MLSLLIRPPQIKPLRRLTRHTIWRRRLQSNSFFFLNFIKQLDARGTKYLGISKVAKKKKLSCEHLFFLEKDAVELELITQLSMTLILF